MNVMMQLKHFRQSSRFLGGDGRVTKKVLRWH